MGERHKHADFIHAWAEGAEVEILDNGRWVDAKTPNFAVMHEYRIKPKIVKREGWVNFYDCGPSWIAHCSPVFHTKEDADKALFGNTPRKNCVHIEWEEEV